MTVFCKVMPENGQPRELNRFVLKAARGSAEAASALHEVTMCALLGNYRHCAFKPGLRARESIIRTFNVDSFLDALGRAPQGNLLMFYVLREFFHIVGKYIASYRVLMGTLFLWEKQSARVCDMMQDVREIVSRAGDWRVAFLDVDATDILKRHYRRMPKRRLNERVPCLHRLLRHVVERNARIRCLRANGVGAFDVAEASLAHGHELRRHPVALLRARGADDAADAVERATRVRARVAQASLGRRLTRRGRPASQEVAAAATPAKAAAYVFPDTLSDGALRDVHDAVLVSHHSNCTFVVALPSGFVDLQVRAIARRFACDAEDVDTLRRVTRVYVCPNCSRIKNFYVTSRDYDKPTRVKACGFEKMVHPSALNWAGCAPASVPRLACAATDSCRHYAVTSHDLISFSPRLSGGLLQTSTDCLTVCPRCGVLVSANALKFRPGAYECPACVSPAPST